MEEEKKDVPVDPGDESFFDKAKKLADKADDYIEAKAEEIKKSKAYGEVSEALDKAEDFIEEKVEQIRQKGVKETLSDYADKAEDKAEEALSKLKDIGRKAAYKAADKIEDIAANVKNKTKEEEAPQKANEPPANPTSGTPPENKPV